MKVLFLYPHESTMQWPKGPPQTSQLGTHLMRAKRLMVRCSLMGTVLTKVVKERPLPRVKLMTLVLGSSACAVTLTSGTCAQAFTVLTKASLIMDCRA